jgi:uncharacterized membrane protein YbhN (UPF0104 family)
VLITALAYAVLPGYDAAALRYVGSRLPLPRVAFGSFIAYAFSQTLGFPLLTGGSVRYRLRAGILALYVSARTLRPIARRVLPDTLAASARLG